MHLLVGISIIAGLLALAYGQKAARAFIGGVLATGSLLFLAALAFVVVDNTKTVQQPKIARPNTVSVPARDVAAIWQRIEDRDARR